MLIQKVLLFGLMEVVQAIHTGIVMVLNQIMTKDHKTALSCIRQIGGPMLCGMITVAQIRQNLFAQI